MLKFCSAPWDTIAIDQKGQVSSCLCASWHTRGYTFGNIIQTPLKDIFASQTFTTMRESVLDQSFRYCKKNECHRLWELESVENFNQISNIPLLPTNINLVIDRNCNLKCAICRTKNIYAKEVNPQAEAVLDAIMDAYRDVDYKVRIYCDASGDIFASLAYRQFFLREDLPNNFEFCLQTNGNLVTKNIDMLTKLKNQIDIMIVSFDAATYDTYKITRGGNFDLVVEGVRQMVQMGITVSTQYVVQHANYLEILEYVKLCKDLGASHIGLQIIDRWPHMTNAWWEQNRIIDNTNIDKEFLINTLKELKKDPQIGLCGGLQNLISGTNPTSIEIKLVPHQ
jgi:MoaA/NifB/PqqE/SkfB family radical SAM enzyme